MKFNRLRVVALPPLSRQLTTSTIGYRTGSTPASFEPRTRASEVPPCEPQVGSTSAGEFAMPGAVETSVGTISSQLASDLKLGGSGIHPRRARRVRARRTRSLPTGTQASPQCPECVWWCSFPCLRLRLVRRRLTIPTRSSECSRSHAHPYLQSEFNCRQRFLGADAVLAPEDVIRGHKLARAIHLLIDERLPVDFIEPLRGNCKSGRSAMGTRLAWARPSFVGSDSIVRSLVTLTSPLLARCRCALFNLKGTRNL